MSGKKKKKGLGNAQVIAFGFLMVIMIGTIILMLPISSKDGSFTNFLDCMFTSVSATCVTGLVAFDTYTQWNIFGQLIILCMIQIGGLGVITISAIVYGILRRRIGLSMIELVQQSMLSREMNGVLKTLRKILYRTFIFEGIGACFYAIVFIPEMGVAKGIYYSVFHSISAFCNAGFDLMGIHQEYSSLTYYVDNPIVNFTTMGLILVGGLGFIVWEEIALHKFKFKKFSLHAKIVIVVTISFVVGGAVLFNHFEYDNLFVGMDAWERIQASLFASVTPRTAGFNTIEVGQMTNASKTLTCLFMFIGGNSGSTAGGIKTTTVIVLFAYVIACLKREPYVNLFRRRVGDDTIKMASMIFCLNIGLIILALMLIFAAQPTLDIGDTFLEVFSAMGTVGISAGITRSLLPVSKIALMVLMFSGRVGTVTFALTFRKKKKTNIINYPEERINVG